MGKSGRPHKLRDKHRADLIAILAADPTATMLEVQVELARRTGVEAHAQPIERAPKAAGWDQKRGKNMDGVLCQHGRVMQDCATCHSVFRDQPVRPGSQKPRGLPAMSTPTSAARPGPVA